MEEQKTFAAFGSWLVKGSDGWLAMLEKLTAEKHPLDPASLGQLKTAYARIKAVVDQQQELISEGPTS